MLGGKEAGLIRGALFGKQQERLLEKARPRSHVRSARKDARSVPEDRDLSPSVDGSATARESQGGNSQQRRSSRFRDCVKDRLLASVRCIRASARNVKAHITGIDLTKRIGQHP